MTKAPSRLFWWSLFIFYTAFIYASLGSLPALTNRFFFRFLAGEGIVLIYAGYGILFLLTLLYIYSVKKERSAFRMLLFFIFSGALTAMIGLAPFPAEKLHILEYGLSGIILYNALKIDFPRSGKKLYLYGSLLCAAAGALDESMQGFLPNRVFQWQDIAANALSGVLILSIIRFNILREEKT